MRVLRSSNARIIVRDAGVWPIFGRKYGREPSRVSRADKSRYFGPRGRETKETERERRGREERVWSVVISLVKAGLLGEFLISVHLPVIPPHRVHNVSSAHVTRICACTYLRETE